MEFRDVVRLRRMVRSYDSDRGVPRELIEQLLGLASRAPSAGFSQGWHFLVLDDPAARHEFWTATATEPTSEPDAWLTGMQSAPVLIVCFSDRQTYLERYAEPDKGWTDLDEARWAVPYWHIDTGMAALLMLLGAVDAGLGGCLFGVPKPRWDALRTRFDIPERLTPIGALSLGYPAPDRRSPSLRRGRREVAAISSYNRYGQR